MNLHKCHCGWSFVIGKKRVYGPIYEEGNATNARMMDRDLFEDYYADCSDVYRKRNTGNGTERLPE